MKLEGGGEILEHTDDGLGWEGGKVRVHVPIVTSPRVTFVVEGHEVEMAPGEVWYCDFARPHYVRNTGPEARVHLVLDFVVNDWLKEQFLEEAVS
jgi:quercetin dioxygenase-like cupin family protein